MNSQDINADDATAEASKVDTDASGEVLEECVGYGRPPRATRFRPGQSGNPRGRPKGARNTGTILKGVLSRKVSLNGPAGPRQVDLKEAMFLRMADSALKGNLKAIVALLALEERLAPPPETAGPVTSDRDDDALIASFLSRQAVHQKD